MGNLTGSLVIGLIFFIVLWLILRELVCWYYKINERISLQIKTNQLLEKLIESNIKNNLGKQDIDSIANSINIEFEIPSVISFSKDKIIFADGIKGEILKDIDDEFFIVSNSKRYYYNSEQNAIKAIYILKTKGEISSNGLVN
jgi:hypothetical protein